MFYFAYGSCMNADDLHRTTPEAKLISIASLNDYKLDYTANTIGRAGGVADIVPKKGHKVQGILWDVPDLISLDRRERHPYVYQRTLVNLQTHAGDVKAITYSVVFKDKPVKPSPEYLQLLLNPALPLEEEYLQELKQYANSLTWEAKTIKDWIVTYWDWDMKPQQEHFFDSEEARQRLLFHLMANRLAQINHRLDPKLPQSPQSI